jgi:hypothetical protein
MFRWGPRAGPMWIHEIFVWDPHQVGPTNISLWDPQFYWVRFLILPHHCATSSRNPRPSDHALLAQIMHKYYSWGTKVRLGGTHMRDPRGFKWYLLGVRKSDGVPEHKIPELMCESSKEMKTRNPRKSVLASKVVNPFTRALVPPFIRRRRDFYIPRLPSNLKNIRSVNMYTNVFYIPWFEGIISHIYKSVTSSHFEPGLLRQYLWPCPSLTPKPSFANIANHQGTRTEL